MPLASGLSYIFRIDEIAETAGAPVVGHHSISWVPSPAPGANKSAGGGASGIWWCCDGTSINRIPATQAPSESQRYKTYSAFYAGGFGFWILDSDALNSRSVTGWQPLRFWHDGSDYSSYLTTASEHSTLACQRANQSWPRMLLPDIYHGNQTPYHEYGALKGELAIFLALVAFSMAKEHLAHQLPQMFDSIWRTHNLHHGRRNKRGVVVYLYTCPPQFGGSSKEDLQAFENGQWFENRYFD